jgi:Flp pilus assembly protein TadB
MPDHTETPRAGLAAASTAVLVLCTLLYAVVAAVGAAPWAVLPALLVATVAYGAWSWYRLGRARRHHG